MQHQHNKKSCGDRDDIDAGLPCGWVRRVNSLSVWDVKSSCEGHHPRYGTEYDHACIALAPKDVFYDAVVSFFEHNRKELAVCIQDCFSLPGTAYCMKAERYGIEVSEPIRSAVQCQHPPSEAGLISTALDDILAGDHRCILNIGHTEIRQSNIIQQSVLTWLDLIAERLSFFDQECSRLLNLKRSQA